MSAVATHDLLSASLLIEAGPERSVELPAVVETVTGGGQQLSRQVEVAIAVEKLVEKGLVSQETDDGTERLSLTDEGKAKAAETVERLSEREIELVEGDGRRELTVGEAAAELDRSPVAVAAECSAEGVYYREDRVDADGIVGREAERERFEGVLDRVRESGDGEVLRLVGPGGNGKTELANALLAATPDDVETVQVTSREAESESFQPLRDAFAQLGVENPIEASGFEVKDAETFESQQTGLFTDITRALTPDSGSRVLVFDDVNQADRATWEYLAFLSGRLADRPLVMVLSHRPGTIPEEAPIHPEADLGETVIELTGLDRDGTKQLIQQVVGRRSVPDAFVDAVQDRTGGTPLFVETTVETLLETNQIDPQIRRYPTESGEFDLPAEVTETIQRQTAVLEADVREILEWVAVAGGYVPASLVAEAAEDTPERIRTVLDTVTGMGLLDRETREGESHVTFRNEVFGDALADRLSESERGQHHETIARLFEDRLGDGAGRDRAIADQAATVAYHYERGGDLASAVEWYEDAAEWATDVYAHETAVEYYYRVIELAQQAADTERVLTANEELAEIYLVTGEYDQAEKHVQFVRERIDEDDSSRSQRLARLRGRIHNAQSEFEAAIEVATAALDGETTVEQCRLLDVLASAQTGLGKYGQARETAQRHFDLADELDEAAFEADAVSDLGGAALRQGAYDQAREYYAESLAIAEELGDRRRKAKSLNNLGAVAHEQGRYDQAREHFRASLAIFREIGKRLAVATTLNNLGILATAEGAYERAEEHLEESLTICREIGERMGVVRALRNIGAIYKACGRFESARTKCEESLAIATEIGDRLGETASLRTLGLVALRRGQVETARDHLDEGLAIARDIGYFDAEAKLRTDLGELALRRGDSECAREYFEEVLELVADHGATAMEARSHSGLCALARRAGDYDQAGDHFEQALELWLDGHPSRREQTRLEGANLSLARGDITTARERAESARETFEEIGAAYWRGRSQQVLGAIEREDGNPDAAREQFRAAVETFEDLDAPLDALETLEDLVKCCREQGDDESAGRWSQRAQQILADTPEEVADQYGQWVANHPEKPEES